LDVNVSVNLQNTAFLFQNESSFWLIPILFASLVTLQTFGQDVTGIETFPNKPEHFFDVLFTVTSSL
jgi:hypothetical protein